MSTITKINVGGVDYDIGGTEYTAGSGISISNGELSVKVDGTTLVVDENGALSAVGGGGSGGTEYTSGDGIRVDQSAHTISINYNSSYFSVGTNGELLLVNGKPGTKIDNYAGNYWIQATNDLNTGYPGNPRGNGAVDLQQYRSSNNQVASGNYSTAMGYGNTASGNYSVAMGYSNTASGNYSVAMGDFNTASGKSSVAMGSGNTSSGTNSVAMGSDNLASSNYSIAMGEANTTSGYISVAMGQLNTASGDYSVAIGYYNTAGGYSSVAMGEHTKASGYSSVAMGEHNKASGESSTALGAYNTIEKNSSYSLIAGNNNTVNAENAIATGRENNATIPNSVSSNYSPYFGFNEDYPDNKYGNCGFFGLRVEPGKPKGTALFNLDINSTLIARIDIIVLDNSSSFSDGPPIVSFNIIVINYLITKNVNISTGSTYHSELIRFYIENNTLYVAFDGMLNRRPIQIGVFYTLCTAMAQGGGNSSGSSSGGSAY